MRLKKKVLRDGSGRVGHLLGVLDAYEDEYTNPGMSAEDAAHGSYVQQRVRDLVPEERERAEVYYDLAKKRMGGMTRKQQADILSKMGKK